MSSLRRRRDRRTSVRSGQDEKRRQAIRRLLVEALEQRILLTTITSVDPPANSHTAAVLTDVIATFDQEINPATATRQTFAVHSAQRGQLVGAATAVNTVGTTVTLDPASDFFPGELVQATATAEIQSTAGQASDPRVWQLRAAVGQSSAMFSDSGQVLANSGRFSVQVSLGDLDADGDLDAFVTNEYSGNAVWLNNGSGRLTDSGQAIGANTTSHHAVLGDLDGDGDLDAFVANVEDSSRGGAPNRVWLNNGSGVFTDSGQVLGNYASEHAELGDLDGDGDLDAFVANFRQGNRVWLNNGGGIFADSGQSLGDHNSEDVSLGDLDGDGDLDAFVARSNRVWMNNGSGAFTENGQSLGGSVRRVSLGDLDGDGDLDAFLTASGGHLVWLNEGGIFTDSGQSLRNQFGSDAALGDLDGDGDLDAFVMFSFTKEQGHRVWLNDGGQFTDSGQSLGDHGGSTVELGDIDGDGDLDAFVAGLVQYNRVWLNQNLNYETTISISDVTLSEYDDSGFFIDAFVPTGLLDRATGLAFGPDGNLYVANFRDDEILRFDGGSGAFLDVFVPSGQGGLDAPALTGLHFGPDGNLYVPGRDTHTVLRYNGATGRFIDEFVTQGSGGLASPKGQVFGPDGNLYVTSSATDEVLRYDGSRGEFMNAFVTGFAGGLDNPAGVTFGPDGNLYVGGQSTDSIFRYDGQTGAFIDIVVPSGSGGLDAPGGLLFGPNGKLYVVSRNSSQVLRYDGSTGAFLDVFANGGDDGFIQPIDLTVGPDGKLYVSDDFEILRYGTGAAKFTVSLTSSVARQVTVDFATANGTATAGSDYTATSGTLTIARFATTATVAVPIILDAEIEADETFFVELTNPSDGAAITDGQGQGTILNNDAPAFLSIDDVAIAEGDSGTSTAIFNVTLAPAIPETVTVNYATADGTATAGSDYQATSGQLTFAPNQTQQSITVPVIGELNVEGDETFFVNLSDPTIAAIADGQGLGTIRDDDAPAVTSVTPLANSHDAPLSTDVVVTFDRNISAATATSQTLAVHSMQRGRLIASAATVSAAGATVTLNPTSDFFPGELVQATVTSSILSNAGQPAAPRVWQLRTAAPLGTGVFRASGHNIGDDSGYFSNLALGDLDSDGDLDAFVVASRPDSANRVWLNDDGAFTDSELRLGDHDSLGISLGDLDGDGDLDAFVTNRSQGNRVWINTSGPYSGNLFSDSGQSLGDHFSVHNALGDVDGDGDLDAFVSNYNQPNRIWLNDGAGGFTDSGQSLGSSSSLSSSLGDVDGDGDLDAFVTNKSQSHRVWLNIAGSFTDSGQALGNHDSYAASLGDLDGDGDLDAFVANSYQGNRVWTNSAGSFSDSGQTLGDHDSRDVALGDLDGDGDLDAFVANNDQGNRLWLNNGGLFSDSGHSLGSHFSFAVALGDLDEDGDLDAVVANYYQDRVWLNRNPTFSVSPAMYRLGEGHSGTTAFNFTVTRQYDTRGAATVDFAFVPSGSDPVEATDFSPAALPSGTLIFADGVSSLPVTIEVIGDTTVENDEGFELTLSNPVGRKAVIGAATAEATIRNDDNVDLGDLPAPFATLLAANGPAHIAAGPTLGATRDTEADGQPSAAADGDDTGAVASDEDGVTFDSTIFAGQLAAEVMVTVSAEARLDAWIDFGGDRSFDSAEEQIFTSQTVLAGSNLLRFSVPAGARQGPTFARFRLSTAGGLAPTGGAPDGEVEDHPLTIGSPAGSGLFSDSEQVLDIQNSFDVSLGDLDGDGDLDAFVANVAQSNSVWLNGGGVFTDSGQLLGNHFSLGTALGDLDGDGDLDAFVANYDGEGNRVWLNSAGQFTDSGQSLANGASHAVSLGDLDNDGDLDAFVANSQGDRVWLNDRGVFTDSGQSLGAYSSNDVSLGDLDGDGDLDAFLATGRRGNRVWINNGGKFTDSGQSLGAHNSFAVSLGDLDGDGDLDAFVANNEEGNRVWLNDGGLFSDSGQSLGGHNSFDVSLGDVDGDGDLDAFVANVAESNRVWLNDRGQFSESGQSLGDHDSIAVALGDLDGDSDLDAFVASYYQNRVWLNQNVTLQVTSLVPNTTGFIAEFSQDLDTSALNLYDTLAAGLGPADVILQGAASGAVAGSIVVDASSRKVTFIKTGGPLQADTYTVSLRSAVNGFKTVTGDLLDGDGNGVAADEFVRSFTVAEPLANTITLGVPDLVRGPGQEVNLPADEAAGIPISISDGTNVRAIDLQISYDPALLDITSATVAEGMPAGASVILNNNTPGLAILVFFSSGSLPAGSSTFVNLQATVPATDSSGTYGRQQVLDVHSVTISDGNDNEFPVIADDAFHMASYFADVSGNGRINASDAAQVARFAALIDTGFAGSLLTDPIVVGDISGNGRVNAADASLLAKFAALIPVPEIPPIPAGIVVAGRGRPAPTLNAVQVLTVGPGTPNSIRTDSPPAQSPATLDDERMFLSRPTDEKARDTIVDLLMTGLGNRSTRNAIERELSFEDAIDELFQILSMKCCSVSR